MVVRRGRGQSCAYESGVEGAGDGDVGCSLNDGTTVGEEGKGESAAAEAEEEIVAAEVLNIRVSTEENPQGG